MALKILIKRDKVEKFSTTNYIPRKFELIAAYDTNTKEVIYKLGDGKTSWQELKEIIKLSELDKFLLYTQKSGRYPLAEIYLNPFMIEQGLEENNK